MQWIAIIKRNKKANHKLEEVNPFFNPWRAFQNNKNKKGR